MSTLFVSFQFKGPSGEGFGDCFVKDFDAPIHSSEVRALRAKVRDFMLKEEGAPCEIVLLNWKELVGG